jgi:hypothetical protein
MINFIKKISSPKFLISVLVIIIFTSVLNNAQTTLQENYTVKVDVMSDKLVKKLLLSEEQEASLKGILMEYFNELQSISGNGSKAEHMRNNSDAKIISLLDNKQKMKFGIIKDDWWSLANQ